MRNLTGVDQLSMELLCHLSCTAFRDFLQQFGWICVVSGFLTAIVFVLFEKKISNPVFDIRLILRNRVFAFSGMAALINYSATSAIGFFISLYLQYLKGLDARSAGLIMISQPIAMTFLSPVAGKLSDKMNPGIIASTGMGFTASGLVLLCFITQTYPKLSDCYAADSDGNRLWAFLFAQFKCNYEFR